MIGSNYWATGITVRWGYAGGDRRGWSATVDYYDDGFCSDDTDQESVSTEGRVRTRYYLVDGEDRGGLTVAIDAIKAAAERLGVMWMADPISPTIYMDGDGENPTLEYPEGWRELIDAQAERLGWRTIYRSLADRT